MGILSKKLSVMALTVVPCQSQTWLRQVLGAAKNTRPLALFAPLTIAVGLMGCNLAMAQDKYPSRPVKIIHSLPAGSSPDVRIRIVAEQLTKMWGQQVVVENRPGGGGLIGVQALLAAAPDGYTLLAAAGSTFVDPSGAEGQTAGRCQSGSRSDRLDRQSRLAARRFAESSGSIRSPS